MVKSRFLVEWRAECSKPLDRQLAGDTTYFGVDKDSVVGEVLLV